MAKLIPDPLWADLPAASGTHRRLLDVESAVDPTGESAVLRLKFDHKFTMLENMHVTVNFAEIGGIAREIHSMASLMTDRRSKLRRGGAPLFDLLKSAMRPTSFDAFLDSNGDRIMVFSFEDHAPVTIALSPKDIDLGITKLRRLELGKFQ